MLAGRILPQSPAAIDGEDDAVDPARLVGGEERDHVGAFLRGADAAAGAIDGQFLPAFRIA